MQKVMLAIIFLMVNVSAVTGEDWQWFFKQEQRGNDFVFSYDCVYDKDSITHVGRRKVRVWERMDNPLYQSADKNPMIVDHSSISLKEFDCDQRRGKIVTGEIVNGKEVIKVKESDWFYPKPGDSNEALFNTVCKSKGRPKK